MLWDKLMRALINIVISMLKCKYLQPLAHTAASIKNLPTARFT